MKDHLSLKSYAVGAGLLACAVLVVIQFAPSKEQQKETTASNESNSVAAPEPNKAPVEPLQTPIVEPESPPSSLTLDQDQTVTGALLSAEFTAAEAASVVAALDELVDFRQIKVGTKFSWERKDGKLIRFQLKQSPLEVYVAERTTEGKLTGSKVKVEVRVDLTAVGAIIESSLYNAIQQAGESAALVSLMTDVLAWDMDFYRDPRKGDRFKALVEKKYVKDAFVGYGRVLAAEYQGEVGKFRVFWYSPEKGEPGYYLPDGRSAEKTFLATPLKFTRISSGFSRNRKHPVLGYSKAHLGVDFAAPTGTPVWAMAKGRVSYAGWKGPNGNLVRIDHSNGLQSAYAHLHRIAKGIKRGVRVRQKQLIGYVGTTGRSTGPHLHFGVKKNGRFVNPRKLKLSRGAKVRKAERKRFERVIEQQAKELDAVIIGNVSQR